MKAAATALQLAEGRVRIPHPLTAISSTIVDRVYLAKRKGWIKYALQVRGDASADFHSLLLLTLFLTSSSLPPHLALPSPSSQHGYSLTPVFTFGERETYGNAQALMPLRLWLVSATWHAPRDPSSASCCSYRCSAAC